MYYKLHIHTQILSLGKCEQYKKIQNTYLHGVRCIKSTLNVSKSNAKEWITFNKVLKIHFDWS